MLASMKARAVRRPVAWILALATGLPLFQDAGASADTRAMLADAHPGEVARDDEGRGQDRARRERQATRDHVLEADLERARGHWIYTLTIMDPQGGVFDRDFDGTTGQRRGR
jgi:uncharacterized membrane protein YkoI